MTTHTFKTPDDLWQAWKGTVSRAYPRIGGRLVDLIAADYLCRQKYNMGLIEWLDSEAVLDEDSELRELIEVTTKKADPETLSREVER